MGRDLPISELPETDNLQGSDFIPLSKGGIKTYKTTVDEIRQDNLISFIASEDVPAFKLVTSDGFNADSNIPGTRNKAIGITTVATLTNNAGKAKCIGQIINPAWGWTNGNLIFLNGTTLSTTPPSVGYIQIVGTAVNANTIEINIHQAIII